MEPRKERSCWSVGPVAPAVRRARTEWRERGEKARLELEKPGRERRCVDRRREKEV